MTCPPDRDIEGLIGEDHARDIYPHESFDDGRIGSISADQAMGAEQEQIAYLSGKELIIADAPIEISGFGSDEIDQVLVGEDEE